MRPADELRALVEEHLAELELSRDLGQLEDAMRYALDGGGKRIRPVLCLAAAEAAGASLEAALPTAAAIELVHTFSLVHDDLPALDDDDTRRGRPSVHVRYGEATAVLAGDALLAEAFRLVAPEATGELAAATLAMIGGQFRHVAWDVHDLAAVNRLKTGKLFESCVACALCVARVPEREQPTWRAFGREIGFLFQLVDDLLDGDGFAERYGVEETRRLADETLTRAHVALDELDAETHVLRELAAGVAARA